VKKIALTLAATTIMFGSVLVSANAQTQSAAAAGLHAQIQNATPVVKDVACQGWGPHCSPGWVWTCGYGRCWCRPCH